MLSKICLKTLTILLVLSLCSLLVILNYTQATPPDDGDWTIKDSEIVSHKSITLNGNIIIKSGCELQLNYADLKFNSNKDFEYKIHIEDGGELEMRYSSINLNGDYSIVIIVEPEGNLRIYNSTIYDFSTIEPAIIDDDVGDVTLYFILIVIIVVIITLLLMLMARKKVEPEKLKNTIGEVVDKVNPDDYLGKVKVDIFYLNAKTKGDNSIEPGEKVKVVEVDNRLLTVEPVEDKIAPVVDDVKDENNDDEDEEKNEIDDED